MADSGAGRLLTAAQAGDPRALEELLAVHRDTVFRYGLRFCRSTEDAEDAVQETLFAAARYIGAFRRAAALTTWLFAIVRNKCHRMLGSHRHEEADLADALPAWAERSAEDEAISAEVRRRLAAALARLEPAHREVLLLRDVEGFTAPEAAARLGITAQALKSRLHRAREALRSELTGGAREATPEVARSR
jgi:RNA polymerase sigma-70 factor (ECF subfamily)